MHDEHLSAAIKDAGESFAPPVPDVHGITRRGRSRLWTARLAVAASVLLVTGGSVTLVRSGVPGGNEVARPAAAPPPRLEWTAIVDAPLDPRSEPVSAWTGSELIVWGGAVPSEAADDHSSLLDGASYDPAADEWTMLPRSPLRTSAGRTAVWTGSEMIVWGGEEVGSHGVPDTGAAYDPATRKWRKLPQAPYWSLAGHGAVWTGDEMIVWGGVTYDDRAGAAYNPETNRWRSIPQGPLDVRHGSEVLWTGDRMVVWGGLSQDGSATTGGEGAAFDPATGVWTPIAESPLESPGAPVSIWTGEEMIVAGGFGATAVTAEGAAYDPATDEWREIRDVPAAEGRDGAPVPLIYDPVWTGDSVLFVTADGVLSYDPRDDRWHFVDAPDEAAAGGATTAWTGEALIVWGGWAWQATDEHAVGGWIARDRRPQSAT